MSSSNMLSAITRKLAQLERETRENSRQLANMKVLLGLGDDAAGRRPCDARQALDVDGRLRAVVLQHEAKLKAAEFRLNRIHDASARQGREILELRYKLHETIAVEADDFDDNGKTVDELGQDFVYNPKAPEFKPRRRELPLLPPPPSGACRVAESELGALTLTGELLVPKGNLSAAAPCGQGLHHHPSSQRSSCTGDCQDGITTESSACADSQNSELPAAIFNFEDVKEELMFYKNMFFKLEIELKRKEELLQNMADALYDSPDRRYTQKRKWFEHKIRLLNQDKRRRGEAIGKLIRCIEDLKDQEHADESLVSEGKYAMQAALKTRGWPQEERIKTTVLSLEADRVHAKLQREAKATTEQDDSQPDNSEACNNYPG